jgi:ElaB/YqjD/DUF883 family membrane-anchored ribosome-binding protein
MAQSVNNPKGGGGNLGQSGQHDHGKDFGSQAKDLAGQAKEFAGDALQKAKDAAGPLAQKAGDAASSLGRKADDAASAVGASVSSFADRMRSSLPREGMLGQAGQRMADTLDQGGRYLQEGGLSGMVDDMGDLIRRNPVPAVLIGLGLGFVIGRMFSRS